MEDETIDFSARNSRGRTQTSHTILLKYIFSTFLKEIAELQSDERGTAAAGEIRTAEEEPHPLSIIANLNNATG